MMVDILMERERGRCSSGRKKLTLFGLLHGSVVRPVLFAVVGKLGLHFVQQSFRNPFVVVL